MTAILQDVRYALRQLRGAPVFTLTAVLTLALGIGATVTMYSIVRSVLLEPLPYPQPDRLVGVALTFPHDKPNNGQAGSGADYVMQHSGSFESFGVVGESPSGSNLSVGSEAGERALQITVEQVSKGYFPTLGVMPMLGRNFTAEEDLPGGPKVVLLSYGMWTGLFNRDAGVVGRVVHINGESYTVVGVMPASMYDEVEGPPTDLWQPLQLSRKDPGYEGDNYNMIARLKPGVSLVQAQQEMDSLKDPFYKEFPMYLKWTRAKLVHEFRVWPLKDVMASNSRTSVLALTAAVIAVLLVACLNLAGLMTARSSRRAKEIALRTALGASRGSVLRLLMTESLLLAVAGAGLGVVLATAAIPALIAASPVPLPQMHSGLNLLVLAGFSLLVACAATLIFGLVQALSVFRQNEGNALQSGQPAGATVSQVRLGRSLLVGQVAVATVLLTSASLLLGSFLKLRSIPSGVQTKRLVIAQVTLKGDAYTTTLHTTQFIDAVMAKLKSFPGVDRIAAVNGLPLDRGLNINGSPVDNRGIQQTIEYRVVTPGYFRTLGAPLLQGRDVTEDDTAASAPVVLVSETAARRWWPGKSAIGEQVTVGGKKSEGYRTVVGVVADMHTRSLTESPQVVIYVPFAQVSDGMTKILNGWFSTTFAFRLAGDVDVAAAVQRAVSEADPGIPVAKIESMQTIVDNTLAQPQFFSWLASGFAGFALLLTMIGLFGLLSYQVTQRTREIGVRLAIGADRGQILMLILQRGIVLTAIGLVIGLVVSLGVPRLVSSVLADNMVVGDQGISGILSNSTIALLAAGAAMVVAAAFASYLPARRAARIEPMEALRSE